MDINDSLAVAAGTVGAGSIQIAEVVLDVTPMDSIETILSAVISLGVGCISMLLNRLLTTFLNKRKRTFKR